MMFVYFAAELYQGGGFISEKLSYTETTGKKEVRFEYLTEVVENGYIVRRMSEEQEWDIKCARDFSTLRCDVRDIESKDTVVMTREGNFIDVDMEGFKTRVRIGKEPWFQAFNNLRDFIKSKKESMKFWWVVPEFMRGFRVRAYKYSARKDGTETIEVMGREVEAVAVKLAFSPVQALFGGAKYWFRKSDGVLLKYSETRGLPGTARTKGELACEE